MKRWLLIGLVWAGAGSAGAGTSFPLQVSMSATQMQAGAPVHVKVQAPQVDRLVARVLDYEGRAVTLLQQVSDTEYLWDGHDSRGRTVSPGTYLIEVIDEPYLWNAAVTVTSPSH